MGKFTILTAIALGFLLILPSTYADLPVHCMKHQVTGKWNLQVTKSQKVVNGHQMKCGHEEPDNPQNSNKAMQGDFQPYHNFEVTLNSDDSVEGSDGSGKWTMVYDEGFEISLNQVKYFAFNKFDDSGSSDCSKTLVGWYHQLDQDEWGCYRGQKIFGAGETHASHINQEVKHEYVVQPKNTFTSDPVGAPTAKSSLLSTGVDDYNFDSNDNAEENPSFLSMIQLRQGFKQHHQVAARLNRMGNSWTAHAHSDFVGKSIKQLNKKAGRRKHHQTSFTELKRHMNIVSKNDDVSDLPKNFDWRDQLNEVYQQRDCGSCYAIATMNMLSARLKIKEKEDVQLAVQHVLDCSYYNQGCDGGYPFLAEKFGSEFELVPEDCHKYTGMKGSCSDSCNVKSLPKIYKVKDYYFIGGSYGKANQRAMMEEIKNNGPIVVSFEPAYDFMMYQSGVYHSVDNAMWKKNGLPQPEWEKVDHSVLCYGWGETESGEKYWMIQNSWGPNWGEDGFFRIRRGTDESAIESLAEAATPYTVTQGSSFLQEESNESESMLRFNDDSDM